MARSYQIPNGYYVNETGARSYQVPGGVYITETVSSGAAPKIVPEALTLTPMRGLGSGLGTQ